MTNSAQPASVNLELAQQAPEFQQAGEAKILGDTKDQVADTEHIYFDLDTILDTHLGTLAKMGEQHALQALQSGRYHRRMIDEFDGIPKDVFKTEYAKRDIETLKRSTLSNMVFFLRRLIKDSLLQAVIQQKIEKMCFTVNVWPYDFDDPGLVEMLIGCIRFHTYSTSSVRIVSIPNEDLTPRYCVENFQIMIRYDWHAWLDAHKTFFEKEGVPQLTLVVPEIFSEAVPTQEDIDRLELKKNNPFRMMEQLCARMFRLKHMPVSLFSLHEAITQESAAAIRSRVAVTEEEIRAYLDEHHPKAVLVEEDPLPVADLSKAFDQEDLL